MATFPYEHLPRSGDGALARGDVQARLPCQDLERARRFYAEKLGLEPVEERDGGLRYRCGSTVFSLFASTGTRIGHAHPDGLEGRRRRRRRWRSCASAAWSSSGTTSPDLTTVDGITDIPGAYPSDGGIGERAVWFRDSEGNLIGLGQSMH